MGTWVYVKLQPYRQHFMALRRNQKLGPKFFGPFPIVARVEVVAYRLKLPEQAKIHLGFHVSLLKEHVRATPTRLGFVPNIDEFGLLAVEPIAILARKLGRNGNKAVVYLLIQWSNKPEEEATWELYSNIKATYPGFNVEA